MNFVERLVAGVVVTPVLVLFHAWVVFRCLRILGLEGPKATYGRAVLAVGAAALVALPLGLLAVAVFAYAGRDSSYALLAGAVLALPVHAIAYRRAFSIDAGDAATVVALSQLGSAAAWVALKVALAAPALGLVELVVAAWIGYLRARSAERDARWSRLGA